MSSRFPCLIPGVGEEGGEKYVLNKGCESCVKCGDMIRL